MIRTLTLAGLLLAALATCAAAQKDKEEPKKDKDKAPKAELYKTPQDCFDDTAKAFETQDMRLMMNCLTPTAQVRFVVLFAEGALSLRPLAKDEGIAKTYKPVFDALDRHGLTEKATKDLEYEGRSLTKKGQEQLKKLVKDPTAFVLDLTAAFEKINPKPKDKDKDKGKGKDDPRPKLTDVKIDGDKATATVIDFVRSRPKDKDKEEVTERKNPVTFEKINGGWRVDPFPKGLDAEKPAKDKKDGKDSKEKPKEDK
jgi:hypothetical protein